MRRRLLQTFAVLLLSAAAHGAITPGNHTCGGFTGPQTGVTTGAIDTTGTTLLVANITWYTGQLGNPTISDSKGNTWSALNTAVSADGITKNGMWYVANPTVGAGHTVTIGLASAHDIYASVCWMGFSGVAATAPLDQQSAGGSSNSASTIQPGTLTPTTGCQLVVTGLGTSADASSIDSGFTLADHIANVGAQHEGNGIAYKVQTTAAAENPTWTSTGTTEQTATAASFKAASCSAATCAPALTLMGAGQC